MFTWLKSKNKSANHSSQLHEILQKAQEESSPYDLFHDADDDFWFWLNTEGYRSNPQLRTFLPSMPDDEIQIRTIGSAGDTALGEGYRAYKLFKKLFEENVGPLKAQSRVLDFGCGWGRTIRFFLRDVEAKNLVGFDPSAALIAASQATNSWCQFKLGNTRPPTDFESNSFDLIYGYSVFSHLPEDLHLQWIEEFHRVLKPDSLLVLTTWQREHIQRCQDVRQGKMDKSLSQAKAWTDALKLCFPDAEQSLSDYDNGKFCFSAYDQNQFPTWFEDGKPIYGEACISKRYVTEQWAQKFTLEEFIDDRNRCPQNVIVVKPRKS